MNSENGNAINENKSKYLIKNSTNGDGEIASNYILSDYNRESNLENLPLTRREEDFSKTSANKIFQKGTLSNFSTVRGANALQQINIKHKTNKHKNLNIVIIPGNSPDNPYLGNPFASSKESDNNLENNIGDIRTRQNNSNDKIDRNEIKRGTIREELEDYYRDNHPFYTSGMKTLRRKYSYNDILTRIPNENYNDLGNSNISECDIQPKISVLEKEDKNNFYKTLRNQSNDFNGLNENILSPEIKNDNESHINKDKNGAVFNKNYEKIKVLGIGGPITFDFDPNHKRRYKQKDLTKAKLYYKYRYVTEKLIETNNLKVDYSDETTHCNFDIKNSNPSSYQINHTERQVKPNCFYFSSDDKNVIKFTCFFLKKIEKAIFLFNMKKYSDSFNYLKDSNLIKNEEEFAEILISFSGFDKSSIGEFLSKEKYPNDNQQITKFFISKMDFREEYPLDSFRYLLSHINLPRENEMKIKISDIFSHVYFKDNCENKTDRKFINAQAVCEMSNSILIANKIFHTKIQDENSNNFISVDDFKNMNKGVNGQLLERIYEDIRLKPLDVKLDYNEMIYRKLEAKSDGILTSNNKPIEENKKKMLNLINPPKEKEKYQLPEKETNPAFNTDNLLKILKKGEIFKLFLPNKKLPQEKLIYLSSNEKHLIWKTTKCSFFNREKSIETEKLTSVYLGTPNTQIFNNFHIPQESELNFLSIIGSKISFCLRNDDNRIVKTWYKGIKHLLKRAKSTKEVVNKKLKEHSNREKIISDFWGSEILLNWSEYRKYLLVKGNLNCQIRFFTKNEIYKKIADTVEKRAKLTFDEKEKENVAYLWLLGIPRWLRKKLWSLVISNDLSINENLFNFYLDKIEEIEFFSDMAIDRKYIRETPLNFEEAQIIGEIDGIPIYDKTKVIEATYNTINNPLLIEIIADINKTFKKFEAVIRDANIEEKKFKDDLFKILRIFTYFRADISYCQPIAFIASILYLNSEDFYEAFVMCCNFIIPSFLTKFLTKDEVFIKYRIQFFANLIKAYSPSVFKHLKSLDISLELFFYDWVEYLFIK